MNHILKILVYSLIVLAIANLLLFLARCQVNPSPPVSQQYDKQSEEMALKLQNIEIRLGQIESQLNKWSALYDLAQCESELDHQAVGDGGRARGILQFHENTFKWLGTKANFNDGRWLDKSDQLRIGLWALNNNYGYLWSCYGKEMQNEYDGK